MLIGDVLRDDPQSILESLADSVRLNQLLVPGIIRVQMARLQERYMDYKCIGPHKGDLKQSWEWD